MDAKLKQRLVGAAVVVSLGIIFLPMLLDGGRHTDMEKIRIEIPDPPRHEFSSTIAPLSPAESKPAQQKVVPLHEDTIDKDGAAPVVDDEIAQIIKPIEVPKAVAEQKPESPQSKPATVEKPPAAAKASPTKANPAQASRSPVSAWVIQVGSFGSRENAIKLRNKLRKKGFTAFVESFGINGKSSHRVRIGPEVNRSRAEKVLLDLSKKMSLKGIIVSYP